MISDMLVYWNYEEKKTTNFWNFMFVRWPEYNWWTSKMRIFEIWDSKIHKKNCKSHSRKCKKGNRFSRNITSSLNRYKYRTSQKYLDCKLKLDEIYSKQSNGVRTRSKCDWYESSEKSNKFFLNLEETLASQGLICSLVKNENEINDPVEINTEL